ncbi:hypothetical protein QTP86_026756 [Hemibagrus guttatus]|nr:hypothetical protein QTP86_026756 [Hemibagrus guttatus]
MRSLMSTINRELRDRGDEEEMMIWTVTWKVTCWRKTGFHPRRTRQSCLDEELNDDLLQSDEEEQNTSAQGAAVSLNATSGLNESYQLQEGDEYTEEDHGAVEGENQEEDEYGEEEGMECSMDRNEDEVLELQIDEPLDDEFQVEDYGTEPLEVQPDQQEMTEAEGAEPEEEVEDVSQVTEAEELEPDMKEESDEDEEDDEESERLRFKTERKDSTVVRLSDAASKRRNIPETLELTEEAKADLLEFEEKERLRKQGRFGGRGRGGVAGGRGRGGGPPTFGMGGFRKDGGAGRGRMNEPRPPLMPVNLGMQPRMISPQSHRPQPRPSGPRGGPGLFPTPLIPIPQQPLQSLMSPRSPAPHKSPQHELHPPRPHGHTHALPHTHTNQQQQPKNIHINPHFRGPASSSPVQVPLISPSPNQPRPNLGPQRFPGPVDFQHFLQPQRPPPQEQWRRPPPPHQEREPFYSNEPRFPAQPLFDLPSSAPLLNNNLLPLSFPQPGPGFCPPVGGMFQRDLPPPRPNLPPPHPSPAPPAPRGFMGHRQPFPPQQHNAPFSPQHAPFGMQGLIQPHPQQQHHHHDHPPPPHHHPMHQHQQHRQDIPPLPHNQHHQHQHQEQHPIMHLSHPPYRQPIPGGPRQMKPRPQNNMGGLRMGSPSSMQQLQSLPQRNSNLRELPIAPGDPGRHHQPRPVTRATQNARPGQGGRGEDTGRGRGLAKPVPPPTVSEMKNEIPAAPSSTPVQRTMPNTPAQDEDEETRQYRLKIEEQKRLREEILKRKEMRRQMQAGARKKELLERLGGQVVPQTPPAQPQTTPTQPQTSTPSPSATPNGVKSRLQNPGLEQKQRPQRTVPQLPSPDTDVTAPPEEKKIAPIQTQTNAVRKRTVMQSVNTGPPQIPQKVRVVKRLAGGEEAPPLLNQPQQTIGRATPQQRLGTARKVTVAAAGPQQQPQPPPTPPQQPEVNQSNRVVVSGRGRGRGARGGRVMPQNRPNSRVVESQLSTVSIDGLSSSTTEKQIKNLLNSIGPIQVPFISIGPIQVPFISIGPIQVPFISICPIQVPFISIGPIQVPFISIGPIQVPFICIGPIQVPFISIVPIQVPFTSIGPIQVPFISICPIQVPFTSIGPIQVPFISICPIQVPFISIGPIQVPFISIGPIQMFKMIPQQRKAIATFVNPQHALSFQHSFHRHMIDLSHIDVTILDS